MKCGVWCEVKGVEGGVEYAKCAKCEMECEVRSVECEVWSGEFKV